MPYDCAKIMIIDMIGRLGWQHKLSNDSHDVLYIWKGDECNIDSLHIVKIDYAGYGAMVHCCLTNQETYLQVWGCDDILTKFAEILNERFDG